MIRISGRLSLIRTEERKTVGEEVKEYSEVANQIIRKKLAEQRLSEQAITRGRENGDEKTPGGEDSDEDKVITVKHKVTMGDRYKTLALRYHTKIGAIKKWNKISRPLKYMIGRELSIPVGRSYVGMPPENVDIEAVFPDLMKAFLYEAKGCEAARARYYLLDSDRDLKKALACWREDDKWEKSAGMKLKQGFKVLKCLKTQSETPGGNVEKSSISQTAGYKPPCGKKKRTSGIELEEIVVSCIV